LFSGIWSIIKMGLAEKWDVLVVGAGPAGSCAAEAAAKIGASVLLVERRATVGVPVRCGEYIPAQLLTQAKLNHKVVIQSVGEMHTYLPGGEIKVMSAPGFIVARDRFDQALAARAQDAGATLMSSTAATDFDPSTGRVLLILPDGQKAWVCPVVIIGADGPHSRVGRWAGMVNTHLMPAAQFRMRLAAPMKHTAVYFNPRISGGYGWLFPRGQVANIGVGISRNIDQNVSLHKLLNIFVQQMKQSGTVSGSPSRPTAGWIPAAPLSETVKSNIILSGDAAGQTHPITGAGIFSAVSCGKMAGTVAARAIQEKNLSVLEDYQTQCRDLFGMTLDRARKRRKLLESNWTRLDQVIKYCWVAFREYYSGDEPQI
jgi:digeranylgeranylglycerophospholipid reductase